ncbi:hypothetical protein ACGFYU_07625 [Streptomyces sp. NPDC048337]|uniref:hypothetical protein n=1 Tax=Streptomyces sp. NPDC048337 TaxID=3365535 RepID=UPI00371427C6
MTLLSDQAEDIRALMGSADPGAIWAIGGPDGVQAQSDAATTARDTLFDVDGLAPVLALWPALGTLVAEGTLRLHTPLTSYATPPTKTPPATPAVGASDARATAGASGAPTAVGPLGAGGAAGGLGAIAPGTVTAASGLGTPAAGASDARAAAGASGAPTASGPLGAGGAAGGLGTARATGGAGAADAGGGLGVTAHHLLTHPGGTAALTRLAEHLAGCSLADLAATRVWQPLGMTRTHYADGTLRAPLADLVRFLSHLLAPADTGSAGTGISRAWTGESLRIRTGELTPPRGLLWHPTPHGAWSHHAPTPAGPALWISPRHHRWALLLPTTPHPHLRTSFRDTAFPPTGPR